MLSDLANHEKVIGLKQTKRAVQSGAAVCVWLGTDADPLLLAPLKTACAQAGIRPVETMTMAELGKAFGITLRAAACATIR